MAYTKLLSGIDLNAAYIYKGLASLLGSVRYYHHLLNAAASSQRRHIGDCLSTHASMKTSNGKCLQR